ncbi:hypothetical protein NQZ68_001016 [Dissostichus eleginoides]|nr:hypothetical protein NQZ68_001016 [Dissostichus eleginoides]
MGFQVRRSISELPCNEISPYEYINTRILNLSHHSLNERQNRTMDYLESSIPGLARINRASIHIELTIFEFCISLLAYTLRPFCAIW